MAKIDFGGDYETPCYGTNCYVRADGLMNLVREWIDNGCELTEFSLYDATHLEFLAKRIRESYKEGGNQ